jgi:hypothetical protein
MRRVAALAGLVVACGGGAGGSLRVVEPVELAAASGAPSVARVRDLGPPAPIPQSRLLSAAESDGAFTVGEYVLVEGSDFGKQPTVLIGGRAARVLARTSGGGILTQIPTGVAGGATAVEVSHPGGRGEKQIQVTRYAVVTQPDAGQAHVLALEGGSARVVGATPVPGAAAVRFSADGSFAYVAGEGKLVAVALAASGGPRALHQAKLAVEAPLDAALAGKLLVVVGPASIQAYDLGDPFQPAPYAVAPLDDEVKAGRVLAADLAPDGKTLALLLGAGNRVALVDMSRPEAPARAQIHDVFPGQRLPLVRDLAFDRSGVLWVVTGDSAESAKTGHVPTRLVRFAPDASEGLVARAPVEVAGAGPPLRLTPAPVGELASGTAIADTSDDLPVFVTTVDARLLPLDGADAGGGAAVADAARGLAQPGLLVRTNGAGTGGPLTLGEGLLPGAVALAPAGDVLLATAWKLSGGAPAFVVIARAAGGDAPGEVIDLGAVRPGPGKLRWPASLGDVQIQP